MSNRTVVPTLETDPLAPERYPVIRNFKRTAAIAGVVALSSASLVACGDSEDNAATDAVESATEAVSSDDKDSKDSDSKSGDYELSGQEGTLVAEGASSQQNAMDYFASVYASEVPGAQLAYTPSGSGAGQKNFIANQAVFAGSDSPLKDDQVQAAADRCGGNEAWHLPFVIGPVAIAYNLDGGNWGSRSASPHRETPRDRNLRGSICLPRRERPQRPVASVYLMALIASRRRSACAPLTGMKPSACLLYTSPSPRDLSTSRMPSSA